ncbi:hypothetical protein [Pseudomonas syringae]|uniref:hypothetical protein n=1 Tax=Pseudomonas syringae TaxID=317 RepID=UPI0002097E1E|nr:hypothetical protein [Pseudomonas syringae]EGH71393.1 hypothetical protein PSYAR_12604 [Pseudomonas syringae pv. aceris str. M302273]
MSDLTVHQDSSKRRLTAAEFQHLAAVQARGSSQSLTHLVHENPVELAQRILSSNCASGTLQTMHERIATVLQDAACFALDLSSNQFP